MTSSRLLRSNLICPELLTSGKCSLLVEDNFHLTLDHATFKEYPLDFNFVSVNFLSRVSTPLILFRQHGVVFRNYIHLTYNLDKDRTH